MRKNKNKQQKENELVIGISTIKRERTQTSRKHIELYCK
jgi:hypothetical protein